MIQPSNVEKDIDYVFLFPINLNPLQLSIPSLRHKNNKTVFL